MTIAGHDVDPARRGFVECVLLGMVAVSAVLFWVAHRLR